MNKHARIIHSSIGMLLSTSWSKLESDFLNSPEKKMTEKLIDKTIRDLSTNIKKIKDLNAKKQFDIQSKIAKQGLNFIARDFLVLIRKAYGEYLPFPAISDSMIDMLNKNYTTQEELREDIAKLLMRIYFSQGRNKIYDLKKQATYNDLKCQALFDKGIFIPEAWLNQLIECLSVKSAKEDMKLHDLTPKWKWEKSYSFQMELYQLTNQFIQNITHG